MLNPHPPLVFPFAHPHELQTCNPPCLTFFPPARTQNLYPPLPTLSALVFIKPWSKAWRQDLSKKIHYKSKGQRGGATDGGTGSTEGSSGVHVALQSSKLPPVTRRNRNSLFERRYLVWNTRRHETRTSWLYSREQKPFVPENPLLFILTSIP